MAEPPKLLDRVREHIHLKRYSIRSEQAYVDWIRRFILDFGKRHPRQFGAVVVGTFLTHLAVEDNVSVSMWNQAGADDQPARPPRTEMRVPSRQRRLS